MSVAPPERGAREDVKAADIVDAFEVNSPVLAILDDADVGEHGDEQSPPVMRRTPFSRTADWIAHKQNGPTIPR
jgi:hypothetical protein